LNIEHWTFILLQGRSQLTTNNQRSVQITTNRQIPFAPTSSHTH
jgi:hypothetical protein